MQNQEVFFVKIFSQKPTRPAMPPPPPPTPPPPRLGLEVRTQWADALLSGAKTIELRAYPPPPAFVGAPVHLLATRGPPGVAALGDAFEAGTADATVPGWVVFGGAVEYRSPSALAADTPRHLVPADDPHYGWREEDIVLYGWRVTATGRVEGAARAPGVGGVRVLRSCYRLGGGRV